MPSGFFITGTDTGAGKTLVACALLRAFARTGKHAVGMKPVAAGCARHDHQTLCEDAENLRAAGNVDAPRELVCPYAFIPPAAPHIAAAQAGSTISLTNIQAAYEQLRALADVVVVEGVGGFRVPLNATQDTSDLARLLALPVILVVGMRLGCLNHAILSAQSIAASGLPLAGWVANQIDPGMLYPEENIRSLAERLPAPHLATIQHCVTPTPGEMAALFPATDLLAKL